MLPKQWSGFIIGILLLLSAASSFAGWQSWVGDLLNKDETSKSSGQEPGSSLSNKTAISGLKQALDKASRYAIKHLGKKNGFLDNKDVRIPMPGKLHKVEKILRKMGASRYADEFVSTMNHAAEKAVVEASPVFYKAIKSMTIQDGLAILKGPDNAATQYFRRNTEKELMVKMMPIARNVTDSAGVTHAYKKMLDKLGFARRLIGNENIDLDQYIANKTLDGLFLMVAQEEKKIRTNPLARTTDLLKTVFGKSK